MWYSILAAMSLRSPASLRFIPYEKIAESLDAWLGDDEAAYRALHRVPWIVTEKIHGANFCVIADADSIRCAKRKALLPPDEDFFGHRTVIERIRPAIRRVFELARDRSPGLTRVFLYGELFGGGYPHPDVTSDPSVQPVQTGCWYSPTIELCLFDLATESASDRDDGGERAYVDYDEAARLFDEAGLLYAKPLFRGSYEDASQYPLGFDSTLPAALGLPPLPPGNKAEGVVIKPAHGVSVPRRPGLIRPVIKRKIAEFAEDERFHAAEKWSARRFMGSGAGALESMKFEVSALVNENRLHAAVSKVGRVEPGDAARVAEILALVIEDLHTEIMARHGGSARSLTPAEAAELNRFMAGEARALVELYLGAP
jgi:Rnl2 family RNA ligase